MPITFDGIALTNPEPFDRDWGVQTKETKLYSGKTAVQASAQVRFAASLKCHTEIYTDISNLRTKVGVAYTLAIDGVNYTKCYIDSFKEQEWASGKYEYEVGFIQDTS